MRSGLFISFEGIDGCGKTTQTRKLSDYYKQNAIPHLLTREPGGDPLAENLREILVNNKQLHWEPESEMLLFLAARLQHTRRTIKPALQQGKIVICDRFMDSSRIYQGLARKLGIEFYDCLHRIILGDFKPNLTFLLDLPAEMGLARAKSRANDESYFESLGLEFYQKLREGFLQLATNEAQRIIVLDATLPAEEIHKQIIERLQQWQN